MDAPEGHDAFSHVVARGSEKAYIKPSSTVKVAMQVTSKQAGGLEAAMRLCRRLYLELEKGKSKEEVEQLKQQWLNLRPKAPKAPKLKAKVRPAEGAHRRKRPSAKEEAKEAKEGKEAEPAPRQKKRRVQPGQPVQRREQPEPALDVKEEPDEAEPRPMARAVFQRPCEGPETLVARVLKDFDGMNLAREDCSIQTSYKSRVGLPPDSPIRPELRKEYEFVIASGSQFSRFFKNGTPLTRWNQETNCDLCNQKCPSQLYVLRCFRRDGRPLRLHKALLYCGTECSKALLREQKRSGAESRKEILQWQETLRGILPRDDWKAELQAIIDNDDQALEIVQKALRNVLGMVRRRDRVTAPRQRVARDLRPPLKCGGAKPLADAALNVRLAPLKVQRSSSVYLALARAIGGSQPREMALRIKELCPPKDAEVKEETVVQEFLDLAKLGAKIFDATEAKDRELAGSGRLKIGTLKLCCIYGTFHGAGAGLSADELRELKVKLPRIFPDDSGQVGERGDRVFLVPVVPAEEGSADAETDEAEGGEGERKGVADIPGDALLLKSRADLGVNLLDEALKKLKERAVPGPVQQSEHRAGAHRVLAAPRPSCAPERNQPQPKALLRRIRVEARVDIPVKVRGRILGPQGKHIRELEARYGVEISVPKERSDSLTPAMTVRVTGRDEEDVDSCAAAIQRQYHKEVVVFENVDDFVGQRGLRDLRNRGLDAEWNPERRTLVVLGEYEHARSAADQIRRKVPTTAKVQIDRRLLGRFREDLQRELLVPGIMAVSSEDGDGDGITLRGEAEAVGRAEQRIWLWQHTMAFYTQ